MADVQVLLYKSSPAGHAAHTLSMRDIKVRGGLLQVCLACTEAWRSSARRPMGGSLDFALPQLLSFFLQPEAYVSKLVMVPGIVTAASRPKHKATYITIQCRQCGCGWP